MLFIISEAPRRSFPDLPAKPATISAGGKSAALSSELPSTGLIPVERLRAERNRYLKIECSLT